MKKPVRGQSIYYASDKNIFDALNQQKVDMTTLSKLFERRNIVISKRTPRDELSKYFSRLIHDYYDHQDISSRLGIISRRERITSMKILGSFNLEDIQDAVNKTKTELEGLGDVVQLSRNENDLTVHVQYSIIDYKRNEFSQVQIRDGVVEFIKAPDGYIVRSTQNNYFESVVDTLIKDVESSTSKPLERVVISLSDILTPSLRSKFFHELATDLADYSWLDATAVHVYKIPPEAGQEDDDENDDDDDDDAALGPHIERVFLGGKGVSQSELLRDLLRNEDYYIVRMRWITKEIMGDGHAYDIEAMFTDPKNCTGFSFILNAVHSYEDGKMLKRGRSPNKIEIDKISRVIESKARQLVQKFNEQASSSRVGTSG